MMKRAVSRRRSHLGLYASAALPVVWAELAARNWSHAKLADELDEVNARVAKLLYGDRRPGRELADAMHRVLGTPLHLWSEPCPKGWRPQHRPDSSSTLSAVTHRKSA